jgi:hypothetical protein
LKIDKRGYETGLDAPMHLLNNPFPVG